MKSKELDHRQPVVSSDHKLRLGDHWSDRDHPQEFEITSKTRTIKEVCVVMVKMLNHWEGR